MNLNDEEKRMYQGEYGPGTQKALTMLIEYGEVFGAEKMVKVHNAHTGVSGGKWLEEILDGVRHLKAFTTTHAGQAGAVGRALGLKEEFCRQQGEGQKKIREMCITGGTPDMLLMQKQNRYAKIHFKIEDLDMENFTEADYGAIGYFIGSTAGTRNVVVEGGPENASFDS